MHFPHEVFHILRTERMVEADSDTWAVAHGNVEVSLNGLFLIFRRYPSLMCLVFLVVGRFLNLAILFFNIGLFIRNIGFFHRNKQLALEIKVTVQFEVCNTITVEFNIGTLSCMRHTVTIGLIGRHIYKHQINLVLNKRYAVFIFTGALNIQIDTRLYRRISFLELDISCKCNFVATVRLFGKNG